MAWDWKEWLAKEWLGKLIAGFLLLASFLIAIVWRESLYGKWVQVTEGETKQALLGYLGLAALAVVIELLVIAYLIYLVYRARKNLAQPVAQETPLLLVWGIYWDKNLNPHCPADKTPLSFGSHGLESGKLGTILHCPSCGSDLPLWDSTAGAFTLAQAKAGLRKMLKK
jgi:hypothetical protein